MRRDFDNTVDGVTYSPSGRVCLTSGAVYAVENLNQHANINLSAHDSHCSASILERSLTPALEPDLQQQTVNRPGGFCRFFIERDQHGKEANPYFSACSSLQLTRDVRGVLVEG